MNVFNNRIIYGLRVYLRLFYPLDYLILLLSITVVIYGFYRWHPTENKAQRVQIYQEGRLYQEADLSIEKMISLSGPLGITYIEIQPGRARIAKDPSPLQYCVNQGWLEKTDQIAICLPNHISIKIIGQNSIIHYDSLSY